MRVPYTPSIETKDIIVCVVTSILNSTRLHQSSASGRFARITRGLLMTHEVHSGSKCLATTKTSRRAHDSADDGDQDLEDWRAEAPPAWYIRRSNFRSLRT